MEVRSGAGSFHVTLERVGIEEDRIVIFGTVDDWDSRTIVTPAEALQVMGVVLRPRVLKLLLATSGRELAKRAKARHNGSP